MLGVVGFLGGYLDKKFSKDSRITIILMVIFSTVAFEVGKYVISVMINSITPEVFAFSKLLFVEVVFNVIITIIVYPIIKKAGYGMENVFKSKNILTRYF